MTASANKSRTNVSIDTALLAAAREHGLNVSAISEEALAQAVRVAEKRAWAAENAQAMAARRRLMAEQGPALARWQSWRAE